MELLPHVIILGLLGFILIISWSPTSSLFSWHPTLMAISIAGFALGVGGMAIIYNLKENAGKPHISTWHALFGVCTMILTFIQLIGGLPLVYSQIRKLLPASKSLAELKRKHAQMGLITSICGLTAVGLAFYSDWFIKKEFHKIYQNVGFGAVATIVGVIFAQVYHGRLATPTPE